MKVTIEKMQTHAGWVAKTDSDGVLLVATSTVSRDHALMGLGVILGVRELIPDRQTVENVEIEDLT